MRGNNKQTKQERNIMNIAIKLDSDVIAKSIQVVAQAVSHEIVEDVEIADAIITDDMRLMLSCLKKSKRVVQFLTTPSGEPATGLMTSYPELFTACCVVPNKGVEGCETLINFLFTNRPKEKS